jgi:LacI family gluconate utilization system Gnt-I transcriptional repressor
MDPRAQRRLAGYRDALAGAGLPIDEVRIMTTPKPSSFTVGGQLLADLLAQAPDTDAIFCNNDDVAIGTLFECQRRGILVPHQMGIVGFNDLDVVSCSVPTITSVRTHRYRTGALAVQMILQRLQNEPVHEDRIDTGFDLIPRQSTARHASPDTKP